MNGAKSAIYEFPITNRIRNFLRYEYLIKNLSVLVENNEPLNALRVLHELLELIRYNDIKSELIQHLQWQEQYLQTISKHKEINIQEVEKLLSEKRKIIEDLDAFVLPSSYYLNHVFLNSVKLRFSIPAGTCNFDLPLLHAWLHSPKERISSDLHQWKEPFNTIQKGISNSLGLSRMSVALAPEIAAEGYYIKNFSNPNRHRHTMIRIKLDLLRLQYPEAIIGKRHFTIHFFSSEELENSTPKIKEDVSFELACCPL